MNTTLALSERHIEGAIRWFRLAAQRNFTQGRRLPTVTGACLYIVCRKEKTPRLLIDFADALGHRDVYELGHTYMQLCRVLNQHLPVIEPELFIRRFVGKLEFEEKANQVYNTAVRIVQRMCRDWIQLGRRPSGICGAALMIAARVHGFRRTQQEILQVVRVCEITLRQRLKEFSETPAAQLTASQFAQIDVTGGPECDPPAFKRARTAGDGKKKGRLHQQSPSSLVKEKLDKEGGGQQGQEGRQEGRVDSGLGDDIDQAAEDATIEAAAMEQKLSLLQSMNQPPVPQQPPAFSSAIVPVEIATVAGVKVSSCPEDEELLDDDDDDFEVSAYINTDQEASLKGALWDRIHADYLAEQELRKAVEDGKKTPTPSQRRSRNASEASLSPAEAAVEMLRKRVSTKINYDALNTLFDTSTDVYRPPEASLGSDSSPAAAAGISSSSGSSSRSTVNRSQLPHSKLQQPEDEDDESPPGSPQSTFGLTGLSEADRLALGYRHGEDDDESFY